MNPLYLINYLVLSLFLTLFTVEVGIAALLLSPLKKYKAKMLQYLAPIWELEGTFAVFYLVNLAATYPNIINVLGSVYVFPALVAGLLLIARNAFLAYSEFTDTDKNKYSSIYAIVTLVIAFAISGIFGSAVSGIGVNISFSASGAASFSPNLISMFFNPFSIALFLGIALIGIGLCGIFFGIEEIKYSSVSMIIIALALLIFILFGGAHYVWNNLIGAVYYVAALVLLLVIVIILHLKKVSKAGVLGLLWFAVAVNLFGVLAYPSIFGGKVDITGYLNGSAISNAIVTITAVGGSVLAISIIYFVYISYVKNVRTAKDR